MGAGKQSIIEGGGKGKDNEAEVSGQALHVKVIGGGGSGPTSDVNIASVGGNPVTTTVPVSGTVSVTEPVSVDDNGGSLTVDTPETEGSAVSGGHVVFPAGAVVDDDPDGVGVPSNGEWTNLRTSNRGLLWVALDPYTEPTVNVSNIATFRATATLHNAQVFNNTTTTANGSTLDVSANIGRTIMVYYDLAFASTPTSIRLVPQFSLDSGTTWFDYSVDQWVEMRFVPGQMPLKECCPLNYVIGPLFRVRVDAVGTDATKTFTVTIKAECVS